ncbi:RagB/SusD family nutrient uptake outer membrane protein [Mucilaginibacter boryungensis]|uniref:RagB/SusD family nutrient uptake outer membrane protein n=1 Tax=Mucilaginibacter boryungensis TaxID=768480 RepID=A0ABR9XGI3_9SPHI|nr:RagB/SusD family nutrient uptake outer membrane protein [Mucilaginibacter boryungensis]MBE9666376.1 RagB/SusD family nutrient uptake outer membrane protein [Mucilaginibacter boryungensis]
MKKISIKIVYKTLLVSTLLTTFSCKKVFDVKPQDQVDITNNYRNVYDANAAVIGIYGQFQTLADRYIILNELRADLMSPTANADQYLRQLNEHAETTDNPWADPRPFYKIILNCNDAMANFDKMVADGRMTSSDYQQRYSDVGAIRSWLYLQLGIQFGSVPYVTDPLTSIDDLKDASKFPKISFDQLLTNLIAFMGDGKRYLDVYSTSVSTTGATNTSLNTTVDGYATNLFFINKRCLLGDLYLWHGDYKLASAQYHYVCELGSLSTNGSWLYDQYLVQNGDGNNHVDIYYGNSTDERTLVDNNNGGWRAIFGGGVGTLTGQEWIWSIPFDKNFLPQDPFVNLFSNTGGSYLLTTSQLALDNWNSQTQQNGLPYDARKLISVRTINGQPVIMKQLYYNVDATSFLPTSVLQKQGRWLLYRGATNMLHFAEAACNDATLGTSGVKLAYALTNVGVTRVYDNTWPAASSLPTDRTNIEQTFLDAPYNLDGRNGETPYYRGLWYRQVGSRTRAYLQPLPAALASDKLGMETAIIDEDGLELAFEGQRWGDLMRVALRRKDPAFLADKVYNKLLRDGNGNAAAVRTKLMNTANWYMPFKL